MRIVPEPLDCPRRAEVQEVPVATDGWTLCSTDSMCDKVEGSSPPDHAEDDVATRVEVLRRALYAEVRRQELVLLDEELAQLEALEGISSAEFAKGVARGVIDLTMRHAWWLARWHLRERLRETLRSDTT